MTDPYSSLGQSSATVSVSALSQPLASAKGWMKFVGIMFIVQGALIALSIIGLLVAWLPIWIGVLLLQSASALERASLNNDADALKDALARLRTYFIIHGVLYLIGLVIMLPYFSLIITMFGAAAHYGGFHLPTP